MLVLHSTSRCDVCLLEYTWETSARVPHAIACGHIFCRDCLYATTPPLCPLCRKQYQPAKIKKLHVDRPENVDEAREAELGKQQLELLEQLVEIWDLELREGLGSDFNEESRDHSAVSRIQPEDGDDRSDTEEDVHGGVPAVPNSGVMGTDGQIGGLLGLRGEENFPFDHGNDVEQILDGIAGAPGIGRGFLERWGSTLVTHGHEEGPIVTVREAQKVHAAEVLRRVDVWLEDKDEDSVVPLRRSRLFFAQHFAVRVALKDALEFARTLNEERNNMLQDLQELENIKQGLREAGEEIQKYNAVVEAISLENHNLKARLSKRSRNPSSPLQNPLPRPPEPISIEQVPTFAQAMSEGSGSAHSGPVYSPSGSNTGVRFAMSPDSPGRARERYSAGHEEVPGQPTNPNGRTVRKKGKGRDGSHYSYRDDSGYFEDRDHWQQPGPAYPASAPPVVEGFRSGQRSNEHDAYNMGHEQSRRTARHNSSHTSRSESRIQEDSKPLDVFSVTSNYLREYSAGFVNGQAAAFGVAPFDAPPPQVMISTPARTASRAAPDNTSIAFTDSMEDVPGQNRGLRSASQSRSPSGSGHRYLPSQISNPQLASILSSPPRAHMSFISLPSVSSHGQPSPSVSGNQRLTYASSHSSGHVVAREEDSYSIASSGLNPPPSLPHDPEAAEAAIRAQYPAAGIVSPSNRSQRTSVSSGWGTVYSNARSNSLISGLRGLPLVQGDSQDGASIRTRATRFSVDLVDIGDRDSFRDSRRESHASTGARGSMSEIEEDAREGSPVRPVGSMVGVLPLEVSSTNSQQPASDFSRVSSSVNRLGSSADTSPHSHRSATAVDRRMTSDAAIWSGVFGSTHSSQSRLHTGSQQSRQSETQHGIAANNDWVSTHNATPTAAYYFDYETRGPSHSPHHNQSRTTSRSRERRSNREEDNDRHRRPPATHRSQTAMGVGSTHSASGSSSWSFEHDATNQSRSSRTQSRSHEQISPTSYPSAVQPSSLVVNPTTQPSRSARERDRDVDRERSSLNRSRAHHGQVNSNTRPSLLTRDSSSSASAFPVSIETTDDERYPRTNPTNRSRTAVTSNDGRSTRFGRQPNNSSTTISNASASGGTADNSLSLQSFGTQNALGLELVTTANGISAPMPVSRTSTQGFLRSFSHGEP